MVSGNRCVGGLLGHDRGSMLEYSHATGRVTGIDRVGGLVGGCEGEGECDTMILQCYSTGHVVGERNVGGLVGSGFWCGDLYCSVDWFRTGSFWDIESSGLCESAGGTGLTTAEMQTAGTFLEAGWDFLDETENGTDDIWWILEGQDYPRLWWEPANR